MFVSTNCCAHFQQDTCVIFMINFHLLCKFSEICEIKTMSVTGTTCYEKIENI